MLAVPQEQQSRLATLMELLSALEAVEGWIGSPPST